MIETRIADEPGRLKRIGILIQARMSSSRLPGKMLSEMSGISLAQAVYERCRTSEKAGIIAIITSEDASDNALFDHCSEMGIDVFRGPLENVLDRYLLAAEYYDLDVIIRVCGDSPFVDIKLIDTMIDQLIEKGLDYVAPVKDMILAGLDSEVLSRGALSRIKELTSDPDDLEHVTLYVRKHPELFNNEFLDVDLKPSDLADLRLTIDEQHDLDFARKVRSGLGAGFGFRSDDVISAMRQAISR